MNLPKNITQIGQSDKDCKIYVEDYVVSYLKQWNRVATDKDIAVALYGTRKEEDQVSYCFLYGACRLDFLQREVRHLSQAQQQEIEKLRVRYFSDYTFLGYRILNGEMIEGFHMGTPTGNQETYRYIAGYAQFYEKNDSMLAYMLDTREQQPQPEVVDREKYEEIRRRQDERRAQSEGHKPFGSYAEKSEDAPQPVPSRNRERDNKVIDMPKRQASGAGMRRMQMSVVAVFAFLCLAGLASMTTDEPESPLQVTARQIVNELTEQKLPDSQQVDTLITEDKLVEALQQENEKETDGTIASGAEADPQPDQTQATDPSNEQPDTQQNEAAQSANTEPTGIVDTQATTTQPTTESTPQPAEPTPTPTQTPAPTEQPATAQVPVAYIIQKGDTLINICRRQYGTDTRVSEICTLNQITNPDDIKIGQIILLP